MEKDLNESGEDLEEGRIGRFIREAHKSIDEGSLDCLTFAELQLLQREQMISEGWVVADDEPPSLPPFRPPPLLPPTITVPDIFATKPEYDTSHMFNNDLEEDDGCVKVTNQEILNKYTVTSLMLGEGATSQVLLAKDRDKGIDVALKVINETTCHFVPKSHWSLIEANLKKCQSSHVVKLIETFSDDSSLYLVFERLSGTITEFLSRKVRWTEADACRVIRQILCAVQVIKNNGLVHGDISPGNILAVDADVSSVRVGGFGKSLPTGSPFLWKMVQRKI
eukprot:TRINITY_DN8303_c0_g1_i3.p2 TRINITY_DN8303_c0_g1~~TRINITY_DN8303_c0_g1_i3.p2  ORF type:complete len:280 (+),score=57.39 TRINITY_DN8303_c0_g1_i3:1716-2555(+)